MRKYKFPKKLKENKQLFLGTKKDVRNKKKSTITK